MSDYDELRHQLANMLTVRQAHMDFEDAVADFPAEHINSRAPNCTYTFWHLIEHIRICQKDILDYIQSDDYKWPKFPDDLVGHFASVGGIAYSPNGKHIVTIANDSTIRMWEAATGIAQMALRGYLGPALHVGFSPDGTRLATHGRAGTLRVYAMHLNDLVEIALSRLTRWFMPEECRQYLHTDTCPPDAKLVHMGP